MEESSISIINRNNGQLTGEKAQALPVQFIATWGWTRYILIGFGICLVLAIAFVSFAKKQVTVVEVTGKSNDFQIYQVQ
jgi:uncharacterized membrane protein YukC